MVNNQKTWLFFDFKSVILEISTSPPNRAVAPPNEAAIDMFRGNCKCRLISWNFHLGFNFHPNTPLKSL